MTSPIDQKWTIIDHSNTMATEQSSSTPASGPQTKEVELTISTKPSKGSENEESKEGAVCTCPTCPVHPAKDDSDASDAEIDDYIPRARPRRRGGPRRYVSPSPVRIHRSRPPIDESPLLTSSATLLAKLNTYDGVADLPYPTHTSVYLCTFPFTDRDVKKFAWLFAADIEGQWLSEPSHSNLNGPYFGPAMIQEPRRSRSPYWNDHSSDLSCVYLSRALDTTVVPEDTKDVKFYIVVQNRLSPKGTKLVVAESRKACGIMMYHEALSGNSIVLVGAVVDSGEGAGGQGVRRMGRSKFMRVETLDGAVKCQEEGIVGIIC
jgi:hypothetical protein